MTRPSGSPRPNGMTVPFSASITSSRRIASATAATDVDEELVLGRFGCGPAVRWRTARLSAYLCRRDAVLQ